jgi:hypothetical protein
MFALYDFFNEHEYDYAWQEIHLDKHHAGQD